jgi:DNA-binding NarL/FixJ family response regulator
MTRADDGVPGRLNDVGGLPGVNGPLASRNLAGTMDGVSGTAESHDETIGVFVVDDHRVVRKGIAAYLAMVPDMELAGEAGDGRETLDRLAALEPAGELPDVVLMDLLMPAMDGIAATREIKGRWPAIEVVAMTSFVEETKVRGALEAGAAGYLLKDADAADLEQAIRAALAGKTHLDPAVARLLVDSVRAPHTPLDSLTKREREVLNLVAEGASNKEIADALVVSERTARTHVSAILAKLGLTSRTQAALLAAKESAKADDWRPGIAG